MGSFDLMTWMGIHLSSEAENRPDNFYLQTMFSEFMIKNF